MQTVTATGVVSSAAATRSGAAAGDWATLKSRLPANPPTVSQRAARSRRTASGRLRSVAARGLLTAMAGGARPGASLDCGHQCVEVNARSIERRRDRQAAARWRSSAEAAFQSCCSTVRIAVSARSSRRWRCRGRVLAVSIERQRIDAHLAAGEQQPQNEVVILADPQALVVAQQAARKGGGADQRFEIAEVGAADVEAVAVGVFRRRRPSADLQPKCRSTCACRVVSRRLRKP